MAKANEKQIKYMDDYRKKNIRYIPVRFRNVEDKEMLEWLDSKASKTAYIKDLILKDMNGRKDGKDS
jgi:hypothetical protein